MQVGGALSALREHIQAVRSHELFGDDIDFKLAASSGAASVQAAIETGFTALSVTVCEVLQFTPNWDPCWLIPEATTKASGMRLHVWELDRLLHIELRQHSNITH